MGDHPTTVLALKAQLREEQARCVELRHEVEELRDELEQVRRELRDRERDTWRPHR